MTKNWDIFPRAEPSGEAMAVYSAYLIYNKFAIAGFGVLTGCVVSWTSSTRVDISGGTYTNNGAPRNLTAAYISSIPAAAAGNHRYDLIYIDGADDTVKRCAGTEGIPASPDDFLENYDVRPAEPTDTDWVPLAIIRVTEDGLEEANFGTNVYATKSVANIKISSPFVVDDVTLQVIDGVMSIKSALGSTKLDDLSTPDDNTDLNVSISAHGLCPKLSNSNSQFLSGTGSWTVPSVATPAAHATSHKSSGSDAIKLDELAAPMDVTTLNVSSSLHGLCPKAPAIATQFLNGLSGGWAVPNVSVYGPYRITHNGGALQAIVTTPALCEIDEIVVKCQEGSTTATVLLGWSGGTDALMTNAEVPKTLNLFKFIRYPTDEITSATALIATVGGADTVGEWDIWLKISRFT
jgi:hypothetical protein